MTASHDSVPPCQVASCTTAANSFHLQVAFHNNGTYGQADSQNSAQKNRAPEFQVTWKYPQAAAGTNNVHAFPNIKLDSVFPETFGNINKLYVDFEWKYILGNDNTSASAVDTLEANNVATNVAIDMFGDKDKKTSADNVNAAYEIMVWFAHFSPSAQVIGQAKGVQHTIKIADEKSNTDVLLYVFLPSRVSVDGAVANRVHSDLFEDKHPTTSQYVMTWRAQETTEKFHGDLYPLVEYLFSSNDANHPTKADYLGSFGMGSEAYDSPQNVTFYVPDFAVNVETSGSS